MGVIWIHVHTKVHKVHTYSHHLKEHLYGGPPEHPQEHTTQDGIGYALVTIQGMLGRSPETTKRCVIYLGKTGDIEVSKHRKIAQKPLFL
jgi:hypothetical protein